ncbi:MAG: carotenoid biosynthesis protein [Methyloceanibacter sp.]|nr:carotenoid biosynthesis protein [Methyloceanibacter sp.]
MNADKLLWGLVALFAVETVASVFYQNLASTVLQLATMIAFMFLHGVLRYRVEGIVVFAVICLVVSNIFENLGVATGFPFGPYHYTDALGPKLFYVPLMIGPAYLSVGYMAWVLATILAGDVRRGAGAFSTFATPFVAAFIMVLWDLTMDPSTSTVQKWWIWESGGGFFGVPVSNYLGWFLTVYVFMQLFALYLRARAPVPELLQPKSYFIQAIAMYAIVALGFVLTFLVEDSAPVTDATGAAWLSGDIYETAAITGLFTMMFVVALAMIKVVQNGSIPAKAR